MKVTLEQVNRPETRRCNYCYIKGHIREHCRKRLANEKKSQGSKDTSSSRNVNAKEVEAEMADVGFEPWDEPSEVTVSKIDLDLAVDDAVFDTGATHDVFNSPKHFISIKEITPIKLTLADGSAKSMITAVGSVRVESPFDSTKFCIRHQVYMCKDLKHNLLSGVAMFEDGVNFHTGAKGLYFDVSNGRMLAKQLKRKWILKISNPSVAVYNISSYQMWHRRLGHPNNRVLRILVKSNACHDLPVSIGPSVPCEVCADAKSTRSSSIGPSFRIHDRILPLVVVDLCGPFQEKSIGGAQYFLQIRDVFSTFVQVTPLINKYDATGVIKRYVAEVERLTGKKIMYWRNDGGGEFLKKELETFFTSHGISLEKTLRYFHEQAGVIERSQRTIQSIMRCLLFDTDLPKSFWSLAATTAAYLHNRLPNVNTDGKTPQEILLNEKPSIGHLRVFWSWAFVHVPQELRKKLDHRAIKCRFVGYLARSKGWQFWNPVTKEFVESAHAKWLNEVGDKPNTPIGDDSPVPDPPSDINRLLNPVESAFTSLVTILETMKLDDSSITEGIRMQDAMSESVRTLAAGLAQKLPKSYKLAMKSDEADKWNEACEKKFKCCDAWESEKR